MTDLTDKRIWRRVMARVHPDSGGDDEMFTFLSAVKEELENQKRITNQIRGKGVNRVKRFEMPADTAKIKPWWQAKGKR